MSGNQTTLVRLAHSSDAAAMAQVHVASWRHAYADIFSADHLASLSVEKRRLMWIEAILARQPTVFVAQGEHDPQHIAGFACIGPSRDQQVPVNTFELWSIYLHPDQWRLGIGQQLWDQCRLRCESQNAQRCDVWVLRENTRAQRFYERQGFVLEPGVSKPVTFGGANTAELRYQLLL